MTWDRSRMKLVLVGVVVFLVGVGMGAALMATIAAKASRAYLRGAQLAFINEQDRLLSQAWRAGDFDSALVHAGCELESEFGDAAVRAFDPDRNPWHLGYSLIERLVVQPNKSISEGVKPVSEATARARLAVVWERLARPGAAAREYANAARLTGQNDPSQWRSLGEQMVDAWSKAEEARER